MSLDYSVTLRNAAELAAWEQSLQAQVKSERQLLKNAQQYKGVEGAARALERQEKIIRDTEAEIERERAANATADVTRLENRIAAHRKMNDEIRKGVELDSRRRSEGYARAFESGSRRGSYSSFPESDPFQAGLRRMENDRRLADETARAAQNAFASGRGGLSGEAQRDPWGEGMAKITGQNQAAAKRAADETAAAQKRLVDEVNRLKVTPLEHYAERMVKLKELLRSGQIDQRGFNAAAKEASERLADAGKAGNETFGERARAALMSYIGGFMTFTGILMLARAGWDALIQAQDKYLEKSKEILEFNLSLAGAQANAVLNLTGLSSERKKQVIEQDVPALQQKTGFGDQRLLLNAVASGYAASGNIDLSLKAAEAAAKINKSTPEQLAVQAGAALDIMRHTGETDPEKALSFLLQANPRGTDPMKIAQNLPPVLGMAKNAAKGDDDKEAARVGAAIFTVLGREGTDYYGDQSGTASNKLLEYQQEFFTKHGRYAKKKGFDGDIPLGRMKALTEDPKLRKVFLDGLSKKGAVEYRPAIENIFTPGEQANKEFFSEFERLNFEKSSYQEIEKDLSKIGQLPLRNVAAKGEANKQFAAGDLEGQRRTIRAQIKKGSEDVVDQALTAGIEDTSYRGGNWTGLGLTNRLQRFGGVPEEVIQQKNLRELTLRRHLDLTTAEKTGDTEGASKYRSDISNLDKQLRLVEQQVKQLEEINQQLQILNGKAPVEVKMPPPGPNGAGRD